MKTDKTVVDTSGSSSVWSGWAAHTKISGAPYCGRGWK